MSKTARESQSYAWVMLALAFLMSFTLHLLLFGTAPMLDRIIEEMNLSYAKFGFIFAIAMVSLIVFRIPWGIMIDKYGYLNILRVSLLIISASSILRSFSPNYPILLLSQFSLGIGLASVLPCLPPLVGEWFPSKTGFGTGIYVSGFALGNGTALGITPILLETMEWRTILLIYGIVASIITILWWILSKSSHQTEIKYDLDDLKRNFKNRYVWVLTFFMIACMGCYDTLANFMPKVLELKSIEKWHAFFLSLGFLFSGPIIGAISDKLKREKNAIAVFGLISGVITIVIIFISNLFVVPLIFLVGFFLMGNLTLTLKAPARHDRLSSSAGTITALISSLGNIGPATIPVLFGYFLDITGTYNISLLMVGTVAILVFSIGSRFWVES